MSEQTQEVRPKSGRCKIHGLASKGDWKCPFCWREEYCVRRIAAWVAAQPIVKEAVR